MKLLLTGGAGYIGSHAAHRLSEDGHEIIVVDNLYSGYRWAVPTQAILIEGDVGNACFLEKLLTEHRFDAVLHFAAHIEVGESVENPAKYYRNNVSAALVLFEACRRFAIPRVIFSSTAAVYGQPDSAAPLTEASPFQPMNPYGASKMMAERILADIAQASLGRLSYVILRYFNAAGARRDLKVGQSTPRATHLIKVACEVALGLRDELVVNGTDYPTSDGTCLRDYIHIEDLAQAHVDALRYLERGGASDVFNVGYGRPASVLEVIAAVNRAAGKSLKTVDGPRRPGDPSALWADNRKIKDVLDWKPQFDNLDLICETAFNWEKKLREIRQRES